MVRRWSGQSPIFLEHLYASYRPKRLDMPRSWRYDNGRKQLVKRETRMQQADYDVAISFAGEDRSRAEELAKALNRTRSEFSTTPEKRRSFGERILMLT